MEHKRRRSLPRILIWATAIAVALVAVLLMLPSLVMIVDHAAGRAATNLRWRAVCDAAPWAPRDSFGVATFNDRLWIIGGNRMRRGFLADVWSSHDGGAWTEVTREAPWAARESPAVFVHRDRLWLVGGAGRAEGREVTEPLTDVWCSQDGAVWDRVPVDAPWTPRFGYCGVVYDDKLWLLGTSNDLGLVRSEEVWFSEDGVSWIQACPSAPWSDDYTLGIACVVYQGRMCVVFSGYRIGSGVWSSTDGTEWTFEATQSGWYRREEFGLACLGGKLWLIGGSAHPDRDTYYLTNDVWFTEDGSVWLRGSSPVPWMERYRHVCLSWKDALWVIGGRCAKNCEGEVWEAIILQ